MLIGQHEHTIDAKKRLALPSKFRGELGSKVIITRGIEKCVAVFTEEKWREFSEKLGKMTISREAARNFNRIVLAEAMEASLDKLGRIIIPDNLREYAGLKKNVITIGLSDKLEIWDLQKWQAHKKEIEKDVPKAVSELESFGI